MIFSKLGLTAVALATLGLAAAHPAAAQTIVNGGFESNTNPGPYGMGPIDGWTVTGGSSHGVANGGAFPNNGQIPSGQVAFLQTNGTTPATLSQTVTGLTAGNQYTISFNDNGRAYGTVATLNVTFGGVAIFGPQDVAPVSKNVDNTPYYFITSNAYTATGTSANLVFSVVDNSAPPTDSTLLLDNVSIQSVSSPVPEASATVSLGLLLTLGGLALVATRRKASAR